MQALFVVVLAIGALALSGCAGADQAATEPGDEVSSSEAPVASSSASTTATEPPLKGTYHIVLVQLRSSWKSGSHGDCFKGPSYDITIDRSQGALRFSTSHEHVSRQDLQNASQVVVVRTQDNIGTCGSDHLWLADDNGVLVLDPYSNTTLQVGIGLGEAVVMQNGSQVPVGSSWTLRVEDERGRDELRVENIGTWSRSGIRMDD